MSPFRLLLADLESAMEMLSKSFTDPLYDSNPDVSMSVFEMQIFAIFDVTVLSHVAKSSKSIIGVSVDWNSCFIKMK